MFAKTASYLGLVMAFQTQHGQIISDVIAGIFINVMYLNSLASFTAYATRPIRGKHQICGEVCR